MHIGLIGTCSESGGASTVLRSQAQLLVESGIEVSVFHPDQIMDPVPGVSAEKIPNPYTLNRVEANRLVDRILFSNDFDLIHFHLVTALRDIFIVDAISKRVPVAITPHSHIFTCPDVKKLRRRPLSPCPRVVGPGCFLSIYRYVCSSRLPWRASANFLRCLNNLRIARKADALIVTCKYMADTLEQVSIPSERIRIVPPPVAVGTVSASDNPPSDVVLFVGRLDKDKGAHYLLEASLQTRCHHQIWIAGDGPERIALELQASRQDSVVRFLGWLREKELSRVITQARVIAMPSLCPETFGLSGLEAMAYGKPVVAFDVGGISGWLEDGETGFIVKAADVGELAEKLALLLAEPVLAEEMGRRGRKIVERYYNPERHVTALLGIYRAVVDSHAGVR